MTTYKSRGTIRVCYNSRGPKTTLFFVPDNDHSVKHGKETYAVFVPQSCDGVPISKKAVITQKAVIIRECDRDSNEVKIDAGNAGCTRVISGAATHQTKVEVWVEVENLWEDNILAAAKAVDEAVCAEVMKEVEKLKKIKKPEQCPKLTLTGITIPAK